MRHSVQQDNNFEDREPSKDNLPQRRFTMYDKTELCNKIHEIYPEIGNCDKDLKVAWDSERNVWEVNFEKEIIVLIGARDQDRG